MLFGIDFTQFQEVAALKKLGNVHCEHQHTENGTSKTTGRGNRAAYVILSDKSLRYRLTYKLCLGK